MKKVGRNKIIVIGISIFVLLTFLICSHSLPVNHDDGHSIISDCSTVVAGLPSISKTILGISGLLLLLGLGFIRTFYSQSNLFERNRNILNNWSPPPLGYPPNNSLFEAFRKGIIHSQIYSFVVV